MPEKAYITPDVFVWARESLGLSRDAVAAKIQSKTVTSDLIRSWEEGKSLPTYTQMEQISEKIYKRPMAMFFMSRPPEEEKPEKNFRTMSEEMRMNIPPDIRYMLRRAVYFKSCLKALYDGTNPAARQIFEDLAVPRGGRLVNMAQEVRAYLGVSLETQCKKGGVNTAFNKWRTCLQDCGVFTFKESFQNDEFSGFCIHDSQFPVIYLNSQMSKGRQIFTLFHELGHILYAMGGLDFRRSDAIEKYKGEHQIIEIACNKFASDFLVPNDHFDSQYNNETDDKSIKEFAKKYKVSREVILRKILDRKIISSADYKAKVQKWNEDLKRRKEQEKKETRPIPFYKIKISNLGNKYVGFVLHQYERGKISETDCADYLDVKDHQIEDMQRHV